MRVVKDVMRQRERKAIKEKMDCWFRGWITDFDEGLGRKKQFITPADAFVVLLLSQKYRQSRTLKMFLLQCSFFSEATLQLSLKGNKNKTLQEYTDIYFPLIFVLFRSICQTWCCVIISITNNKLLKTSVSPNCRHSSPHHPLKLVIFPSQGPDNRSETKENKVSSSLCLCESK